jgi:hypothetical protein
VGAATVALKTQIVARHGARGQPAVPPAAFAMSGTILVTAESYM